MASKKIILSVPENIMKKLKYEKVAYSYNSIQEIILEALREKYFRQKEKSAETRGRPRKLDEARILTAKKIFSKKGVKIDV